MQWCALGAAVVLCAFDFEWEDARFYKILAILLIGVGNILFGKIFCSHLCPLGLLQELREKIIGRMGEPFNDMVFKRWSVPDKILRAVKYLLLVLFFAKPNLFTFTIVICTFIFVASWMGGFSFCKYLCPVNALSNILRYTVVLAGFVLLNILFESLNINLPKWVMIAIASVCCYYLEIKTHKAEYNTSLLHIHKNHSKCNRCRVCTKVCPYNIDFKSVKRVTDIDCNLCGECVRGCSQDAIKVGICNTRPGQNRIRGIWFAPLITVVLLAIALCLIYS